MNAATGTGAMTIPIPISPGRSGFDPHLSLSYDSASGNGPFGFGWSLPLARISRKTDKGLPEYRDADESDVYLLSGAEDLVPVLGPGGNPVADATTVPGYVIHRYRPRIEGLFARIERWTELDTGEIHWRSITRENVTTLYGRDNHSRIFDPADPAPAHPTRIFAWLLCESYDDKGNVISYEYADEDGALVDRAQAHERNRVRTAGRYLKRIKYGNRVSRLVEADLARLDFLFEVVLDYDERHYEELPPDAARPAAAQHQFARASSLPGQRWAVRPDPFSSYRGGFEVRTYRRCRRVLMFHLFPELGDQPCLVRSVELDYADLDFSLPVTIQEELAHQGSTRIASFIQSMTTSGFVRDTTRPIVVAGGATYVTYLKKSLPRLELEYSKPTIVDELREIEAASVENLPIGLDGGGYKWVDLDGEGVAGILTEDDGGWFYKPNLGEGRFGSLERIPSRPAAYSLGSGSGQQLLDISGDGQLDLVNLSGPAPGFYERTLDRSWAPFRAFRQLPRVNFDEPDVRFIDLDGDGRADVLIGEDDVFTWYPSLADKGFGPPRQVRLPQDDERGPRLVLGDAAQSIYLADMSGDGLTDLVRIRNGEVCYWPNLGHGRFGAKVTMDDAPRFDLVDQFDQRRIRLVDVDGSGTVDILYLGRDAVHIYFNLSGNRWSRVRRLTSFPQVDNLSSVSAVDLLGNGTGCLVWSSPGPAEAKHPLRYVDLMGGRKPHLLVGAVNNLGAETHVTYASSTKFYLADKAAGRPWITRIPFPVHVIERVEIYDRVNRNRFATRRAYHHGYFDGTERELHGFGLVEQWDTEEMATLTDSDAFPTGDNIDAASHVPPVLTKTWFHTGVYLGRDRVSSFFAGSPDGRHSGEYYRPPGVTVAQALDLLLPDTVLPDGLNVEEEREACRALKGSMLRQEMFCLDQTDKEERPYAVTEQDFTIEVLQRRGINRHAVFLTHARESLGYHYERTLVPVLGGQIVDDATAAANPAVTWLTDPRVIHTLTLEVDGFGNVLRSASIAYGRRFGDLRLPKQSDRDEQARTHITCSESEFTNAVDGPDDYRAPLPRESRTYELTGLQLPILQQRFTFKDVAEAATAATPLDYEQDPTPASTEKRLIGNTRQLFRSDDLTRTLALGELESRALPFQTYKLAFTPGMITQIYAGRATDPMLAGEGRYVHSEGDARWWIPSGRIFYSPGAGDAPAVERAYALQHFFLPQRYRDPFHSALVSTESFITYDAYDLLLQETRDPLGSRLTAGERDPDPTQPLIRQGQDYRVLQPTLIMDANRNLTTLVFDALGLVAGTAVMGKPENPAVGDRLRPAFKADLTQSEIDQFVADPTGPAAAALLDDATSRLLYDVLAFSRGPGPNKPPAFAATLARETHAADPVPPGGLRIQCSFSYSDGFGREIQKKAHVEPGQAPLRGSDGRVLVGADGQPTMSATDVDPRWAGSGWTVFDNKGNPIRKYEPFFSDTHRFEFDLRIGVSAVVFYDPVGRAVGTLVPNHTWQKVVFDSWRQATFDVSDTVLVSDPSTDADVGSFFGRLPDADYLPSWYDRRQGGALGAEEQSAARKAAIHAGTPTVVHGDSQGRAFLTIQHNRFKYSNAPPAAPPIEEFYESRTVSDIQSNPREIFDAKDRLVARYSYDILGNRVRKSSIEAGERWVLDDSSGKALYAWDDMGHRFHSQYDPLRRPTATLLQDGGSAELTVELHVYGESQANPELKNQRGRAVQILDQAGVVTTDEYDFKGNLLASSRRLAQHYDRTLDWSAAVPLGDTYASRTSYDALNRPTALTSPDNTLVRPAYNEAGLLEQIDANLRGALSNGVPVFTTFVTNIDYDAKGQRTRIEYGNGVRTTYEYDRLTFRITHVLSRRDQAVFPDDCPDPPVPGWPGCQVQSLDYTYDPSGNVTHVRDDAQQAVYFRNTRVEASADYTHDATQRLIDAAGREHLGRSGGAPIPHSYNDFPRIGLAHPNDGNAMGRYFERYVYDAVGNILSLQHRGTSPANPGWTRDYTYEEPSLLEAAQWSNRLTRTTVGADTETYSTAGDGYDAHGNLLRMPHLKVMQWDFRNQLQMTQRQAVNATDDDGIAHQGERTYYVYDSAGQRVRKVTERPDGQVKDERTYVGVFEVYRLQGMAPLVRETLHIMDGVERVALVETRTQGGAPEQLIRYQLTNHLGSASLELDDQASIISYEEYTPYGSTSYQAVRSQTEAPKRFRFTGKERDEESGLGYHSARYYAHWLGRWTACDPIGLDGGINAYVYVSNAPTRKVDPSGFDGWDRFFGGVKAVGGALEVSAGVTLFAAGIATSEIGVGFLLMGAGGVVVAHGADTTQSGVRQLVTGTRTDSLTSTGLQAAGMSPRAANLTDAGVSVVFTWGAGAITRAPSIAAAARTVPTAGEGLVHLTTAESATAIGSSQTLGTGATTIYAGPASLADATGAGITLRTGLLPSQATNAVAIPEAAASAFRTPAVVGPLTGWQSAMGTVYSAEAGTVNLTTGAFTATGAATNQIAITAFDATINFTAREAPDIVGVAIGSAEPSVSSTPGVRRPSSSPASSTSSTSASTPTSTLASAPTPTSGLPNPADFSNFDQFSAAAGVPYTQEYLMDRWASVHGWASGS